MEQGQEISLKELLSHLIIPATTAQPLVSHAAPACSWEENSSWHRDGSAHEISRCGVTHCGFHLSWLLFRGPPTHHLARVPLASRSPKQAFFVNIWCHLYRTNSPAVRAPVSWQALRLAVQGSGCVSFHKSIIRRLDGTGLLFKRVEIGRNEDRMHC